MTTIQPHVTHDLNDVNAMVRADAAALVAREEARYDGQIAQVARSILQSGDSLRTVLLCGPSSVGKTTTARRLCGFLERHGTPAFTVSLDDFYRGVGKAPRLSDGSYDYESPEALDLDCLNACVRELVATGQTRLPRYDFTAGAPVERAVWLHVPAGGVVIFEGINAFSPQVGACFDGLEVHPLRVFINTVGRFALDGERVLSRRDVRLCRRLLRDERTRASSFENTMQMWTQVMAGEERYIFPYVETADAVIDTTMAYEPCVLAGQLLSRLPQLADTAYADKAAALAAVYGMCEPLAMAALPRISVVREFVGLKD